MTARPRKGRPGSAPADGSPAESDAQIIPLHADESGGRTRWRLGDQAAPRDPGDAAAEQPPRPGRPAASESADEQAALEQMGLEQAAGADQADPDPAWWLNLRAQPDAEVEIAGQRRPVHARTASAEEAARR